MQLGALPAAFAGLAESDAREAASYLQPLTVEAGDVVMEQGEEDFTLAFVVQGAIQLTGDGFKVGAVASREMIGEVELFSKAARVCGGVASSPTQLQVLAHEDWLDLCAKGNPAVYNVERAAHRRISERIRWLQESLAERARGAPYAVTPRKTGFVESLTRMFSGAPKPPQVDVTAFLRQCPTFGWADQALLSEIAAGWSVERFDVGSLICRQGEVGERVHLLVEGELDLMVMLREGRAERLATLRPGEVFGDVALGQNASRTATVVSPQESVVLSMPRERYGQLFAINEPVGSVFRQAMLRNLIRQLQATQARFVAIERALAPKDDTLRGTPLSMVWRD